MYIMKLSRLLNYSSWKWFIKCFLLWLVFACLWLTSFSSACSPLPSSSFSDSSSFPPYTYFMYESLNTSTSYCLPSSVGFVCPFTSWVLTDSSKQQDFPFNVNSDLTTCFLTSDWREISGVNFFVFFEATYTSGWGGWNCPTCPTCQDCSSIESAYETLSWYYATCQSNLTTCQWSLSWYDSCQGSLGACLEDNLSLENMNESLSSQLEACLLNGWNGCDPEVDTGCITGAFQVPLLSWSVWLDSFTTPIINNLTLPTNYKWKIVDWVLTISSVNNNLSISDSDMEEIKDSIVEVSQYIFRLALILMIIYYIKFYIFNSKK